MLRPEVFEAVILHLEEHSVPYFVTGLLASSYYGEPRMTQDAGVVTDIAVRDAERLCREMAARGYYADDQAGAEAVRSGSQFNVIDARVGFKIDLKIVGDEGFDGLRMKRRRRGRVAGLEVWISAPEDVVLKKLISYREGGSDKHLRDVAGMLRISGDSIDREYMERWSQRLGVDAEWRLITDHESDWSPRREGS